MVCDTGLHEMSFLTNTRIIGKDLKVADPAPYAFDLVLVLLIYMAYTGVDDLRALGRATPVASASAADFSLIGALGIYGIRLSSIVAIIRKNRQPQVVEWLAFIIPMAFAVFCFLTSGMLVRGYAAAHGYRTCYKEGLRSTVYVFAMPHTICPPKSEDK